VRSDATPGKLAIKGQTIDSQPIKVYRSPLFIEKMAEIKFARDSADALRKSYPWLDR
jgi:hypothetical protein